MGEDLKRFTREQIKELTFRIPSLDPKQRELVREMMFRLHDAHDGIFYRRTFHLELLKLRESFGISEIDRRSVEEVFFG